MKKRYVYLVMILLLTLTACGSSLESAPDVEPALTAVLESESVDLKPTPAPTDTAVADAPQAMEMEDTDSANNGQSEKLPADVLLVFHRSGGFAGLVQQWTLYTDGRIEMPGGTQQQVDISQIQSLRDVIQAADFFALAESYVPADACCDRFTYTITVQMDGQTKTVTTVDDAPKQPAQLTAVIEAITTLITDNQ